MPIYAYRCEACGHSADVLQKISDTPLSICPSCGADSYRKQVVMQYSDLLLAVGDQCFRADTIEKINEAIVKASKRGPLTVSFTRSES